MSLLSSVKQATEDTSKVEVLNTSCKFLSGIINGQFGQYRKIGISEGQFNVDSTNFENVEYYKPNCPVTVTVTQYTNKKGEEKTYLSSIRFHIPDGALVTRV